MDPKVARLALPNEPFFEAFFQHFKDSPNRPTFHDSKLNIDADYTQFLQDVHATQMGLQSTNSTGCKDCPYVFLLNPCNYEFAVAAFAILATGRAVVPLAPAIMPEEAVHLMRMCRSTTLLMGSTTSDHGSEVMAHAATEGYLVDALPICTKSNQPVEALIDKTWDIEPSSPVPADPEIMWERLRQGGITFMSNPPMMWGRLRDYFLQNLDQRPSSERDQYLRGMQNLRAAGVSGSALPEPLGRFWREMGRPLAICYGATELGRICLRTSFDTDPDLKRCIGRPRPGISVRLSDGDHGELEIKSPTIFSEYLNDPLATKQAFTADGFYRTGDCGHKVGDDYIFDGRVSSDFIKFRGYRVPVIELETRLNEVSAVVEAYVVPVPDENYGYRVGVLIHFDSKKANEALGMQYIRSRLSNQVPMFMMPTALRVLASGDTVPRTASGKLIRKAAAEKYFLRTDGPGLADDVEAWSIKAEELRARRAWDWGGTPMAG
ncbi:NRPS-like protein biosynthetic cluster [Penicillium canescens]|nr:NRPS-like protein biosynthetic cluster [Penicillium canescens]